MLEIFKIRMPLDWWCQLLFWFDVTFNTAIHEPLAILAIGLSLGTWLVSKR